MLRTLAILAAAAIPLAQAAPPEPAAGTWTAPEQAAAEDPDFAIQGEYGVAKENQAWGAQVVALGEGRFDAYLLEGGLPGLGWTREQRRTRLSGTRDDDGRVRFTEVQGLSAEIADGRMQVRGGDANPLVLPRIERQSPTLGAAPPVGAIVLFDGSDTRQWRNASIVGGLLAASGATSVPGFGDCSVHIEFRTPYQPLARGQGRGNSGVYYAGRWETQVLDSFGLTGEMNECGGIYSIAKPRLNMCLPPLAWQTYDVEFTAPRFDDDGRRTAWARITVKLNGVIIHQDQELPSTHTTAAPITGELRDEPGPIFLQAHGNPVFYRNIWVLPK